MSKAARNAAAQRERYARTRRRLLLRRCFGGAVTIDRTPDQSLQHDSTL
jgi:hypothetical protein